ncbi:MAG: tetratricopeptide repeat protein [Elusimicrobia bacterium]|nr:tetratricopeptide repeat protein [Elusimicrobiota bacterium]
MRREMDLAAMGDSMNPHIALRMIALAMVPLLSAAAWGARWGNPTGQTQIEEETFSAASLLFQESGRDQAAVIQAFEKYIDQFPDSSRIADAEFLVGEAYLKQALSILKDEAAAKKSSSARLLAPKNPVAVKALEEARRAFGRVINDKKSGLASSAQYRLGEVAYNDKDWARSIEEFKDVEQKFPKSYIVGEALMGIVFANLALEQFSQAEANLFLLGETFPTYLKEPAVLYAQGIVFLYKGDYANAEKALKMVKTPEAQYYLGKTFLLSKRAYLAAAAFEQLLRDYPESDLREEAQFFIGDSFFLAEDYDGAISKYQRFISLYPESPLRVSAMFRIGSSYFQKKDYVEARANFQAVIDRYPKDFFAPLAQYSIAETHLVGGQLREALFAYTKVITQYPGTAKVSPLALFKLAWSQINVGDNTQVVNTCENFLKDYPNHALAKNVYLILGNALINLKRHNEAVAAFQRIIDLAPSSDIAEQALFSILQNQLNQKNFNSILTSYQYIFRHLPPSKSKWRSLSYLYAAEAYLSLNQVDEAKTIYEMILKVYPDEPAALYAQDGLAWCYTYKGEDAKALEEREKLKDMLAAVTSTFTFTGLNELGIADSMFNQKNYEDAYQLYDKFAREHVGSEKAPSALYRSGLSLYHLRYYSQAVETWKKLAEQYPQSKEASLASGQVADTLFRAQKFSEAVEAYRKIVANRKAAEQMPLAYLRIAQSAFNMKDDAAAMKEIQELVARFPKAPEANDGMDLLEAILDRNKKIDFKETLRAIIAVNPNSPVAGEAQFRLARRAFESKDYATAAAEFQKFSVEHTNNPHLAKAQFYLGESYFNANDWANAAPAFERLINNFERSDDTSVAVFHLASSYYSLKRYDDAVRYYSRLLEEYPGSEFTKPTQFNLALSYKALGKLDMAQYAYQKYAAVAGSQDPSGQAAQWEIFTIQKDRRDFDGALATLEQIQASAKPGSDVPLEATYRMGEVYASMNRPDEALNAWEKLRAMKPGQNPFRLQALIKLGEAYEKASDFESAIAVYEDLGRNANKEVARSALQRAAALRKTAKPEVKPNKNARTPVPRSGGKVAGKDETKAAPEPGQQVQ